MLELCNKPCATEEVGVGNGRIFLNFLALYIQISNHYLEKSPFADGIPSAKHPTCSQQRYPSIAV
jgi:hypothetical protein